MALPVLAKLVPSKAFTRSMLDGHGLIGVIFGAVLYILCLSGALIVLTDQWTIWERPEAPVVESVSSDRLVQTVQQAYVRARVAGVAHDVFVTTPSPELPHFVIAAYGEGGGEEDHRVWSVDPAGRLGPEMEARWVAFVENLHFNLTVPGALGRYVVGIFGTILLASLITGILAHRRIFRDAFRLRWGGARRLTNADLHNRIGVWALPFHLIVSLTGSLLGLSGLIILILALVAYRGDQAKAVASLLGPQATEDSRAAPVPDIRPMLARIDQDIPGARVSMLRYDHVGTAGQLVTIFVAAPRHLSTAEAYIFAPDGALRHKAGFTDGNVGTRLYGMITPLHYGTYGGLPLKIIYALLGFGLTAIVATGGNVWLARRREQGRAAPKLERLWTGLLWGQPLVFALAALAAMAGPLPLTPFYWAATFAVWIGALLLPGLETVKRAMCLSCGLTLILLVIVHIARNGVNSPVATAMDIALLGTAALMLKLGAGGFAQRRAAAARNVLAAAE